jgi:hypothetical protein
MSKEQLQILQHALGVDEHGRTPRGFTPYTRNHFCAGDADEATCRELVALGYMVQHPTTKWLPYFNCSVTLAGIKAMHNESPRPPKLSPGQKRYREFLNADTSDSFGQWLKDRKKETHV